MISEMQRRREGYIRDETVGRRKEGRKAKIS